MRTEPGEYIVGAYLKIIKKCEYVDYNVKDPDGGLKGLNELDVVGLDLTSNTTYLCEVTTHLHGLRYGDSATSTIRKIKAKHAYQKKYAKKYLSYFKNQEFVFWSPYVPKGKISSGLAGIPTLDLVINQDYTVCIDQLRQQARITKRDAGNPFFRYLQILEQLR